ncbi:tetratricopeptide repeat protein [Lacinutrix mariniflava]|uniref:tetratricopeptide repeat protein n=1 Tax=Lacinutrix mariniflava TaxID=342955 RepID=UPI0006E3E7D9|nr:tetratricopeptide repeat protein [Lacinutrix mariniflava]
MNINEKIFELYDYIDEHSLDDNKELEKHLNFVNIEWDKLPDSKLDDSDRTLLADTMIECLFKTKNYQLAENWVNIYLDNKSFPEEVAFHYGRLEFEKENFEKALKLFKEAYKASKGRIIEGKGKYKDFFLHPEKYIIKE